MNVSRHHAFMAFVLIRKMVSDASVNLVRKYVFQAALFFLYLEYSLIFAFSFTGFSGDLCNFEYNECDSNPCVNGLCIDHIGTYSCQCTKGYQGRRCHIKVHKYYELPSNLIFRQLLR